MTIDERVDECVKKILHSGDLTRDVIKATLIAAVEEERKAILREFELYKGGAYSAETRTVCENLMALIRTRSEGEQQSKGD